MKSSVRWWSHLPRKEIEIGPHRPFVALRFESFSGVGPANQTKERSAHELVAVEPKFEEHNRIHKKGAIGDWRGAR